MKTAFGVSIALYSFFCFALVLYTSQSPFTEKNSTIISAVHDKENEKPNFTEIKDIKAKKQSFFNYLRPLVDRENRSVQKQRDIILKLQRRLNRRHHLNAKEHELLQIYSEYYQVEQSDDLHLQLSALLQKVNIVPRSLVLAQAANESAWGTSRFATQGNNYFGQWCFKKGCGLVPKSRNENSKHEVRVFSSPSLSIRSYIYNINTHRAYKKLRAIRADEDANTAYISGEKLAEGLIHYSERGSEYVNEIKEMIRTNKLEVERIAHM